MPKQNWSQLIRDLRGNNVNRAVRACELISEFADESNVSDLYSLLNDDSFFIREAAADPLARLEGIRALPSLFTAYTRGFQDGHDNDGLSATITNLLTTNQKEVTPILLHMLKSADEEIRSNVAWALGFVASQVKPDVLLDLLDTDTNPETISAAIGSLSSFKGYPEVVDRLIVLLNDNNEQIKISTISSLGYLGDTKAIIHLEDVLKKSSGRIKDFAKYALQQLNIPKVDP